MPRLDHRLRIHDRLSVNERLLLTVILRLVNQLRERLQLDPITDGDVAQLLRQLVREQD
jgi:hypothetical protein